MPNIEPLDSNNTDLKPILAIIPYEYRSTIKLETGLQVNLKNLLEFYKITNDEMKTTNGKRPIITMPPYQYLQENQAVWLDNVFPIVREVNSIYKVIMDMYKELYRLEVMTLTDITPPKGMESINNEIMPKIEINTAPPAQPQQKPRFQLPEFLGGKSNGSKMTPFGLEVGVIKEKQKRIQDFFDYVNFHNFKLDWYPDFIQANGLYDLLSIERTQFFNRVGYVIQYISEGYEIKRSGGRELAVKLGMGSLALGERHRMPTI